jgi:hypothetical protein
VLLTRKIPEATITLEIDESYTGVILLDGKEMFVEPKISALILSMIEQVDSLSERLDAYEKYITGTADA